MSDEGEPAEADPEVKDGGEPAGSPADPEASSRPRPM
jgi:hypothetical protein